MLAVPCVIFWAYESIFWFRADIKMDFIFVQKLRQMLFGSVNSFVFFLLGKAAPSAEASTSGHHRLNLINMSIWMRRSEEQRVKMAVIQHPAQGHFSMTAVFKPDPQPAGACFTSQPSGVWLWEETHLGTYWLNCPRPCRWFFRLRCQLSNENSAYSECQRCA